MLRASSHDGIMLIMIHYERIEKPFVFVSQRHYEALGDVIVPHIQQLMVNEYKLREEWLPVGAPPVYAGVGENKVRVGNNIFMSHVIPSISYHRSA